MTKRSISQPCDYCDGTLESRTVTVDWRRKGRLIVIEDVPISVCNRCGERYYTQAVMKQMEEISRSRHPATRTLRVPVAKFEFVV